MKKIRTLLGLMILLIVTMSLIAGSAAAQQQVGDNLLVNSGFEGGHHNQNGISEITVPNGWRMHWVDGTTFPGAYNDLPAHRPETVVWNSTGGVPVGEELLWRDGIYTLKIFKPWAPVYAAMSQEVTGLQVGRRYRLIAPVFADIVKAYEGGQKVGPDIADAGQVRLGAGLVGAAWRDETAIAYSGWWTGASVPGFYFNYQTYIYDFTAVDTNMSVWVEVRSTYPYPNNGFFMDTLGLYALDAVDNSVAPVTTVDPNAPTPTPFPTPTPRPDGAIIHVVQPNDSFWTIAIQYASALDTTPENALDIIRDINNNPAFIAVGQELIIAQPQSQLQPLATPEEEPTAVEESVEPTAEAETAVTEGDASLSVTTTEEEPQPFPTAESSEAAPAGGSETEVTTGTVCVGAFEDTSGDGSFDNGSEALLSGAALTLSRGGSTVSTYVSDGATERHCFENLEPDTYQIQFFPPADYRATTQDNGWIAVAAGSTMPVAFGAQFNPAPAQEVASVDTAVQPVDTSANTSTDTAAPVEDGGNFLTDNIGTVIIGIAVFLVILALIGVVLLRRG
jgi:hypothetical protein